MRSASKTKTHLRFTCILFGTKKNIQHLSDFIYDSMNTSPARQPMLGEEL